MNNTSTLVATLGGQPQIVTFTLDLLLERGEQIDQVIIVYISGETRYRRSYKKLAGEFPGDRYRGNACRLRSEPIRLRGSTLGDARSPSEIDAVWKTFFRLFTELKNQEQRVHLSLTGGRRIMALLAYSVALLHFTSADRAWHIHTPEDVVQEAYNGTMLHAPPQAGLQLIEVPLIPWGSYFPGMRSLLHHSPQEVRNAHLGWLDDTERNRCERVWNQLTPRQRDSLRALTTNPTRELASEQLGITISTLDSHKTEIIRACHLAWDTTARIDVHFLRQKFAPFLAGLDEV